jgi:hypothetical protein
MAAERVSGLLGRAWVVVLRVQRGAAVQGVVVLRVQHGAAVQGVACAQQLQHGGTQLRLA